MTHGPPPTEIIAGVSESMAGSARAVRRIIWIMSVSVDGCMATVAVWAVSEWRVAWFTSFLPTCVRR